VTDVGPDAQPHSARSSPVFAAIQHDFAQSTRIVYLTVAGIMAASFLIALRRMEREVAQEVAQAADLPAAPEATS
jgi:hypothetical protein